MVHLPVSHRSGWRIAIPLTLVLLACAALAQPGKPPFLTSLDGIGVSVAGTWIPGVRSGDSTGRALAGAGDVNSDGYADFLIGAPQGRGVGASNAGEAHLIFGGPNGAGVGGFFDLDAADGLQSVHFLGSLSGERVGLAVAGAGDVNGDGFDDFLIGAPSSASSTPRPGTAYLIYGRADWSPGVRVLADLPSTEAVVIEGILDGDRLGVSAAGVGDINGDLLDDFLLGASGADPFALASAGEAYLIYGNASGHGASIELATLNGTNGVRFLGVESADNAGLTVAGVGDVNADNLCDFAIGAPNARTQSTEEGKTFLIYGSTAEIGVGGLFPLSTLDGVNGVQINGIAAEDHSSEALFSAGDFSGDGIADLAIGSPDADPLGRSLAGQVHLVLGAAGGLSSTAGVLNLQDLAVGTGAAFNGAVAGDHAGGAAVGIGDIDGDGRADLLIGAPMSGQGTGKGHVIFGRNPEQVGAAFDLTTLNLFTGRHLLGSDLSGRTGGYGAPAGDVNGDGVADFLISGYLEDAGAGHSSAGMVYLINGWASTTEAVAVSTLPSGATLSHWIGAMRNGADPWGPVRVAMSFSDGSGPGPGGSSVQGVIARRTPPSGGGLPTFTLPVHWEIATSRTGWTDATITFHATPREVLSLDETSLQVYRADTVAGPWTPLTTTVDINRNEITATGVTSLGTFAIGTGSFITSQQVIEHLLDITPLPHGLVDAADLSPDGEIDIADVVVLINIGR